MKYLLTDFEETLTYANYIPNIIDISKIEIDPLKVKNFEQIHKEIASYYYNIKNVNNIFDSKEEFKLHYHFYKEVLSKSQINNIDPKNLVNWRLNEFKFFINDGALEFLNQLKIMDYEIVFVTNALPSRLEEISNTFNNIHRDRIFISSKIGYYKPQKEFYTKVISKLKVKNLNDIIYIDDRSDFIQTAKEIGINKSFIINHSNDYSRILKQLL